MSMLRNLATSLVNARNERIVTTLPKAKELRPFIERAVTLSRHARAAEGENAVAARLHLRRQAASFFHAGNAGVASVQRRAAQGRPERTAGVAALKRLFDKLGERFADRPGGYTRIIRLGRRDGDNAELAIIEFVGNPREVNASQNSKSKTTTDKKKTTRASETKAAAGGRRGGRKADKTYEKKETTAARGQGEAEDAKPKSTTRGRRAKKTEQTSAEKDAS